MENQDTIFAEIKDYTKDLIASYSGRDETAKGIEDIYLMHDTEADAGLRAIDPSVALTKSPEERIKVQAVVRLLTTSDPEISMPRDINMGSDEDIADMIEQGAQALLASSDRVNRRPLHYDAVLSAVLHDMVSIRVICTQDILDQMEQDDSDRRKEKLSPIPEARKNKVKKLVDTSPYIFEAMNSRLCYPVFDRFGLQSQLNVSQVRVQDIINSYGGKARSILQAGGKDLYEDAHKELTLYDYIDDLYRCIWIEDGWLVLDEHGLPFIPIATTTVEGSSIFSSYADQCQPLLYTVYKSGLDQRKTEAMTAMYTNRNALGLSPTYKYTKSQDGEDAPTPIRVGLVTLWVLPNGAQMEPVLNKGITDPSTYDGLALARELTEQATIYNSVLGESQSQTYSQTALLSQLGRIPLETTRRMVGRCLADALEIAIQWVKHNGKAVKAYNYGKGALSELAPADIPDYFNLEVTLEPALAQDKLMMAKTAQELKSSELVDNAWIQENFMNIKQPKQMAKDIIKEKTRAAITDVKIQGKLSAIMAQLQQAQMPQQPMQPPMQPPGGGGLPPEMMAGGMGGPEMPMGEQQMMPPDMEVPDVV